MRRKVKFIVAGVVLAVLLPVGFVAVSLYIVLNRVIPDAYAAWNVAAAVNRYLDAHDGAWPHGWEDLRKTMEATENPWNHDHFVNLKSRVEVDWNADPRQLADAPDKGSDQPFRVIWLRDGSHNYWEGAEPNRLVWSHLQERKAAAQTRPSFSDVGSAPRTER